jgi:hypothetical protein
MKVRIVETMICEPQPLYKGAVVTLSQEEGQDLINRGLAVLVVEGAKVENAAKVDNTEKRKRK